MKRIFILLLFISLFFNKTCYAFDPFEKDTHNPLPFTTSLTDPAETFRYEPFVLHENGLYKMWYAIGNLPHFRIAYATSTDGISWNTESHISLLDSYDIHDPDIVKIGPTYYMYFASEKDGPTEIYRVTSTDGVHFDETSLQKIMSPSKPWEQGSVSSPSVAYENGLYYLFYSGMNSYGWRIGMATSSDGIYFEECSANPIFMNADGSFLYTESATHYLFVHGPDRSGIALYKTTDPLSCSSHWEFDSTLLISDQSYDARHISSPSVLKVRDALYLYYSGLGTDRIWSLNRAIVNLPPQPSSIVIVPGMLASWNKEAVLHNKEVTYGDWHLLSFVHEYDGLLETLKNAGLKENDDYFLFPYDWRKSITDSSKDLESFIETKVKTIHPNRPVSIVGHSLGGLVGSAWVHSAGSDNVANLITVGSPHQGVIQAYKPVEAGEIDRDNTLMWLTEKLILILNKSTLESDKQTMAKRAPVLHDLFPIFPFLDGGSGELISISSMTIKNDLLQSYYDKRSELLPLLHTLAGNSYDTPARMSISPANGVQNVLGNYPDGVPMGITDEKGDGTVLERSAAAETNNSSFSVDHGDLIAKKEGIKNILNTLHLPVSDQSIVEGTKTTVSPSIVFLLQSPAVMQVTHDDKIYNEDDGILFIPQADSGTYHLAVKGTAQGTYTLHIGQIAESNDVWEKVTGEITADPPDSQTDTYTIIFNSHSAIPVFPSPTPTASASPTDSPKSSSTTSTVDQTTTTTTDLISAAAQKVTDFFQPKKTNKSAVLGKSIKKINSKKKIANKKPNYVLWILLASILMGVMVIAIYRMYKKGGC